MMAQGAANLRAIHIVLAEALQATLALNPSHEGQKAGRRDIATARGDVTSPLRVKLHWKRGGSASS